MDLDRNKYYFRKHQRKKKEREKKKRKGTISLVTVIIPVSIRSV